MRTEGEASIAKMESQTLILSSSSHSFKKTEQRKKDSRIQGNQTRHQKKEDKKERIDLPNKICGLEQQLDEY